MTEQHDTVVIIGGGIGGLSAALALHRLDIKARVLERAPELREVGAGLGLWTNAMRVLDQLGIGEQIRRAAMPLRLAEACSWTGRLLSRTDAEQVLGQGAANHVMHRAELHAALLAQLPASTVETGSECLGFQQSAEEVLVQLRARPPVRARLLVGADGIHSAVRTTLWGPQPLRYSGQTCYRGIAMLPPPDPHVIREIQGPGKRAGICPLDQGRVYWWVALNAPQGERDDPARRREDLLQAFQGWPFALSQLIEATPGEILRNDLVDRRPLRRWGQGRVTLLGDAAHPMLPNLGQGACSAIEDGLVLARALATHGPTPEALRQYEQERIGRTSAMVRQSWNFGLPVRWSHPWAVRLRETLVRHTPAKVVERVIRQHVGFDVGPLRQQG